MTGKTRKALSSEEAVTRQWHRRHGRSGESPSKGSKGLVDLLDNQGEVMTRGTYTAKQLADFNCRCTRCEEAKHRDQLEAVKRAIESFKKEQ